MSVLQTLKLAVKPQISIKPEHIRRQKLITRLQEQLQLVEAQLAGVNFHRMKWVNSTDDNGLNSKVQRAVRVRPWWVKDAAGTILMTLRYGKKTLEISKGLNAVHVGQMSNLPNVIKQLLKAIETGELDAILSAIASENPFHKRNKSVAKLSLKRN